MAEEKEKIESKYFVGQEVFFMANNAIIKGTIFAIAVFRGDQIGYNFFEDLGGSWIYEDKVFISKKELLKSL